MPTNDNAPEPKKTAKENGLETGERAADVDFLARGNTYMKRNTEQKPSSRSKVAYDTAIVAVARKRFSLD